MTTPFDSRLGPGTLTLGALDFAYQASAVRLTPDVSPRTARRRAVPDPAPESSIAWALNIDAIQDFENPAASSTTSMDNALSRSRSFSAA